MDLAADMQALQDLLLEEPYSLGLTPIARCDTEHDIMTVEDLDMHDMDVVITSYKPPRNASKMNVKKEATSGHEPRDEPSTPLLESLMSVALGTQTSTAQPDVAAGTRPTPIQAVRPITASTPAVQPAPPPAVQSVPPPAVQLATTPAVQLATPPAVQPPLPPAVQPATPPASQAFQHQPASTPAGQPATLSLVIFSQPHGAPTSGVYALQPAPGPPAAVQPTPGPPAAVQPVPPGGQAAQAHTAPTSVQAAAYLVTGQPAAQPSADTSVLAAPSGGNPPTDVAPKRRKYVPIRPAPYPTAQSPPESSSHMMYTGQFKLAFAEGQPSAANFAEPPEQNAPVSEAEMEQHNTRIKDALRSYATEPANAMAAQKQVVNDELNRLYGAWRPQNLKEAGIRSALYYQVVQLVTNVMQENLRAVRYLKSAEPRLPDGEVMLPGLQQLAEP